jgi:hypothetical protein
MKELRIAAIVVGAAVFLCLLVAFIPRWVILGIRGDSEPDLTYRFVLPDGYVGWVRVDFGLDSAPKVFKRDRYHEVAEIKIAEDGRARTSDLVEIRSPKTEYEFFYDVKGSLLPVDEELVSHEKNPTERGIRTTSFSGPVPSRRRVESTRR